MIVNSYYEEEQSILNYIMSYGRRNNYGGCSYGGRGQSNFGGPKPVEIGKEYDVQVAERSDRGELSQMNQPIQQTCLMLIVVSKV